MRTDSASNNDTERSWFVLDASDIPLGRLASRVASVLRGKHRPDFSPHADNGDFVVIVNAEKVKLTGAKLDQKRWYHHSHYPGGLKEERYRDLIGRRPEFVIEKAVKGMLPKTSLGRRQVKKLKVYAGDKHPHSAQKPEPFKF